MPRPDPILPDLLAPNLRLVFCGSALGAESARQKAYYAKPGNRFWPTLHAVGLTPRRFAPAEYAALLPLGIGLTDLNKTESGNDDALSPAHDDVAGLAAKIETYQPGILAFTAKRPAQVFLRESFGLKGPPDYGLQPSRIGRTQLFVLPSTSGSGVRYWDIGPWRALKKLFDRTARADGH
jgi:TDG/mug DNA glycosylase family protein